MPHDSNELRRVTTYHRQSIVRGHQIANVDIDSLIAGDSLHGAGPGGGDCFPNADAVQSHFPWYSCHVELPEIVVDGARRGRHVRDCEAVCHQRNDCCHAAASVHDLALEPGFVLVAAASAVAMKDESSN